MWSKEEVDILERNIEEYLKVGWMYSNEPLQQCHTLLLSANNSKHVQFPKMRTRLCNNHKLKSNNCIVHISAKSTHCH